MSDRHIVKKFRKEADETNTLYTVIVDSHENRFQVWKKREEDSEDPFVYGHYDSFTEAKRDLLLKMSSMIYDKQEEIQMLRQRMAKIKELKLSDIQQVIF